MLVKKHNSQDGRVILAVCDADLIGKEFEEGDAILDLRGDFYKGEETSVEELKKMLNFANAINAVGKESIEFLKKQGEVMTKTVDGIPHAMIVFVRE